MVKFFKSQNRGWNPVSRHCQKHKCSGIMKENNVANYQLIVSLLIASKKHGPTGCLLWGWAGMLVQISSGCPGSKRKLDTRVKKRSVFSVFSPTLSCPWHLRFQFISQEVTGHLGILNPRRRHSRTDKDAWSTGRLAEFWATGQASESLAGKRGADPQSLVVLGEASDTPQPLRIVSPSFLPHFYLLLKYCLSVKPWASFSSFESP